MIEKEYNPPLDITQIREILPHRYPFLLIDRVLEFNEEEQFMVGYKNVTANEPFFPGHFPQESVMPGRSEERRVGKESIVKCRSRWSPYH